MVLLVILQLQEMVALELTLIHLGQQQPIQALAVFMQGVAVVVLTNLQALELLELEATVAVMVEEMA
jgi:hypothetical protein